VSGTLKIGGNTKAENVNIKDLDVGGTAKVAGGEIRGKIGVGGKLKIKGNLKLSGSLNVGEVAKIDEKMEAESIDVGDKLRARRINASTSVNAGGEIATEEGVKAEIVQIGRKGRIRGVVVAKEVNLKEKSEAEDIYADTLTMREKTKARNIYAKRIYLEGFCRITEKSNIQMNLKAKKMYTSPPNPKSKLPTSSANLKNSINFPHKTQKCDLS